MKTMNFGKYAVLQPVTHKFEQEPDWWWKIKPPTAAAEMAVARLLTTERKKQDVDGTLLSTSATSLELAMREIAVTYAGTNIPASENDPAPILPADASLEQVEEVLRAMPRMMIIEIWEAVGDACPGWGPVTRRDQSKNSNPES